MDRGLKGTPVGDPAASHHWCPRGLQPERLPTEPPMVSSRRRLCEDGRSVPVAEMSFLPTWTGFQHIRELLVGT